MEINGTLIWYYYICPREVWLISHHLEPFQGNEFIEIGRLISEESYQKDRKEVRIDNIVIDILKKENEKIVVGEVKKSSKFLKAATMQLAYYLLRLKRYGIDAKGTLLFPKEKKKIDVELTEELEAEIIESQKKIKEIVSMDKPPEPKLVRFCSKCGYQEFCWS